MRPGWLAALAFVLAALVLRRRRLWHRAAATGFATHVFHVKPLSTDQSPPALLRPGACRARAVSGASPPSPSLPAQLKMRRRTHSPTAPSP